MYKKHIQKLGKIQKKMHKALDDLKADPLLESDNQIFLEKDKKRIEKHWLEFQEIFSKLDRLEKECRIRAGFLGKPSLSNFAIRYTIVHIQYWLHSELRKIIQRNIRSIEILLDERHKRGILKLRRKIHHPKNYTLFHTPYFMIRSLRSQIHPDVRELIDIVKKYHVIQLQSRLHTSGGDLLYFYTRGYKKVFGFFTKRIGLVMSRIRVKRFRSGLITSENIQKAKELLKPGDIIITRGNWNATNASIPGFWKHMSMYAGTGEYINENFPEIFERTDQSLSGGDHYIIEATGKGINFDTLEGLTRMNDYLCGFRTRFSHEKIQRTMNNTFKNLGKGYDFIFDYYSDENMVCSELVTKGYLPEDSDDEGLNIELDYIAGNLSYPPNKLVQKFNEEYDSPERQLDFVVFIEASEKQKRSFLGTEEALRESWKRSRWSLFQK